MGRIGACELLGGGLVSIGSVLGRSNCRNLGAAFVSVASLAFSIGVFLPAVPAWAHHSHTKFDMTASGA